MDYNHMARRGQRLKLLLSVFHKLFGSGFHGLGVTFLHWFCTSKTCILPGLLKNISTCAVGRSVEHPT